MSARQFEFRVVTVLFETSGHMDMQRAVQSGVSSIIPLLLLFTGLADCISSVLDISLRAPIAHAANAANTANKAKSYGGAALRTGTVLLV